MRTLILITILFFSATAQMPTGTATPLDTSGIPVTAYKVIEQSRRLRDPTQNVVCQFWSANWGKVNWPGTKAKPWPFQWVGLKRGARGKWVCDVSRGLEEVNGTQK